MSLLRIDDLTLRFGGLTAVDDLSCSVEKGEIVAVIGPNGAGKTSVFNAVTGIYEPTAGKILVAEKSPRSPVSLRSVMGCALVGLCTAVGFLFAIQIQSIWDAVISANYVYQQPFPWIKALGDILGFFFAQSASAIALPFVAALFVGTLGAYVVWNRSRMTPERIACCGVARTFQNIRLFPQLSVMENVLLGMDAQLRTNFIEAAFRLPFFYREKQQSEARARELLAFVELTDEAEGPASCLSYGHRRRLEIARALASRPKILLLDEPAAGMNPAESKELVELIRKIRQSGVTVLLIEHHMPLVMGISDRIIVLNYGKKIAEGTPAEIRQNPAVIEAYLGKAE